jgi:hypothetical protein
MVLCVEVSGAPKNQKGNARGYHVEKESDHSVRIERGNGPKIKVEVYLDHDEMSEKK